MVVRLGTSGLLIARSCLLRQKNVRRQHVYQLVTLGAMTARQRPNCRSQQLDEYQPDTCVQERRVWHGKVQMAQGLEPKIRLVAGIQKLLKKLKCPFLQNFRLLIKI